MFTEMLFTVYAPQPKQENWSTIIQII